MPLVPFDPSEVEGFYEQYYQLQDGNGLAVFRGKRIMDGDGLGSLLSGVFKAVTPSLKSLAKTAVTSLGKRAIGVAGDILRGENAGESALRGLKNVGGDILSGAHDQIDGSEVKNEFKRKRGGGKMRGGKRRRKTIFDGI